MPRLLALLLLLCAAPAAAQTDWAARLTDGDVTLGDFHFRSGETLPALRIHYATLGTPHRDAAGHVDNAVMILHGTGGTGRQFLAPQFADVLSGPAGRSTSAAITSSCPMRSVTAVRPSPATACGCASRITIMTTWSRRSAQLLVSGSASRGCGWSWAPRWAACTASSGPRCIRTMRARRCRWPACRSRSPAATGCGARWRSTRSGAIPAWTGGDYTAEPLQGLRTAENLLQLAGIAPQ